MDRSYHFNVVHNINNKEKEALEFFQLSIKMNRYLFENPPSRILRGAEILFVAQGIIWGIKEKNGLNLGFSKFVGNNSSIKVASKTGMFITYFPTFLICSLLFLCNINKDVSNTIVNFLGISKITGSLIDRDIRAESRLKVVSFLLAIHFCKRVLEVLFVHKYSGTIELPALVTNSLSYPMLSILWLYVLQISEGLKGPQVNLMAPGITVYLVGIVGNGYHHYLLSKFRSNGNDNGEKKYVIPHGGFFEWLVCPHYLFEMVEFFGLALISQTVYSFCVVFMMFSTLLGRSITTKNWYLQKFEDFPQSRKALIPFLI